MASELRTPLCDVLGIECPILSVGMGQGARAELAAAVSRAGGLGVLGASGVPVELLRDEVLRTRSLTDRPFGINIIVAELPGFDPDERRRLFLEQIRVASRAGARVVVLFWGDPSPYVDEAQAAGMRVLIQVGSVDEAERAAEAGVDAVNVQGMEAGGHVRGTTSIWDLIPATVDAVGPVPVIASGGIGNGEGVARALSLGAQGVSLGTRFVASDEANVHPEYKRRIVDSTAADTVYTEDLYDVGWPAAPHRTLRNTTYEEWDAARRPPSGQRPGEGTSIGTRLSKADELVEWPRYASGMVTPEFEGDLDLAPMWAGESCGVVNDVRPAGEIVRALVAEALSAQPRVA